MIAAANGKEEATAYMRAQMAKHPEEQVREAVTERGPVHLRLLDPDMNEKDM